MVILSSQDVEFLKVKNAATQTPQVVVRYREHIYSHLGVFNDLDAAVAESRQILDSGGFCLIVSDAQQKQHLWKQVKTAATAGGAGN
jgi:hypothetical protein